MSYQKNHRFLLKIFAEIVKKEQNAILLLAGTGEKEQELIALVEQLALNNQVVFLGNRSDVAELYQAMDVFVLPSHFEGIPVVGVEAQFADLPCVFSDKVPSEVAFSEKVCFLPLSDSPEAFFSYSTKAKRGWVTPSMVTSSKNIASGRTHMPPSPYSA